MQDNLTENLEQILLQLQRNRALSVGTGDERLAKRVDDLQREAIALQRELTTLQIQSKHMPTHEDLRTVEGRTLSRIDTLEHRIEEKVDAIEAQLVRLDADIDRRLERVANGMNASTSAAIETLWKRILKWGIGAFVILAGMMGSRELVVVGLKTLFGGL